MLFCAIRKKQRQLFFTAMFWVFMLLSLILSMTQWHKCQCLHFIDEETEA